MGGSDRNRASSDFDNKTDDEDEKSKGDQAQENLSPTEQAMNDILSAKRQEVIVSLIESLSAKNKDDFEACLNASTILTDLTEHNVTFSKLIQRDNVIRLMEAACDITNVNQSYALSVLASVIKEYPDFERSITQAQATEF
jgi:hypothetical protein